MNYLSLKKEIDELVLLRGENFKKISKLSNENKDLTNSINELNSEMNKIKSEYLYKWITLGEWIKVDESILFDGIQTNAGNVSRIAYINKNDSFKVNKINNKSVIIIDKKNNRFRVEKEIFLYNMMSNKTINEIIISSIERDEKLNIII